MANPALAFKEKLLLPGTYTMTVKEFIEVFCKDREIPTEEGNESYRAHYAKAVIDIHDWAEQEGARSIVLGGSFVSLKQAPADIDVLIFFASADLIPKSHETVVTNGVTLDIQLLSEEEPEICAAYLELLGTARNGTPSGLVQIKLNSHVQTHQRPEQTSRYLNIIKVAYLLRRNPKVQQAKGLIVPIHGIRTHAEEWLPELCLTASTSGWAVAPFVYGYQEATILRDASKKTAVVQKFRDWLIEIRRRYPGPISIVAHSFGTYIIGRYIRDAGDLREKFDAIILCGSILNVDYDWGAALDKAEVGRVLNTISTEDEYVKFLPEGGVRFLVDDPLFGKAGCRGFTRKHDRLKQIESSLLTHNNVFKDDVVIRQWLPFLELSKDSQKNREWEIVQEHITKGSDY